MADPEQPVKKTILACDRCRRRKRKCDGRTPICTTCKLGNAECLYSTNLEQRARPRKNYVTALEARIALLEQILKNAEASDTVCSTSDTNASQIDNDPSIGTTPVSSPVPTPQPVPTLALVDDAADILKYTLDPTQKDNSEELDLRMEDCETLLSLELEHKLLAQFWDWQRMHLPYIAPVPFLSAYAVYSELTHPDEPIPPPRPPPTSFAATALNVPRASTVKRTSDLSEFISPLLLYSMFAIAALFNGDAETSEIFYERARRVVFVEATNPRVATVQATCLMATWELGHANASAGWTLLGVALSVCIRLGMNVDATPLLQSGAISQRLFETRNFVFWAAFNTERFHATCMGMRPLIDRRIISTPKHSSPTANPRESSKSTARPWDTVQEICTNWWSPSTLGMEDVLIQAAWDSIRDLIQMMDDLFDSVQVNLSTKFAESHRGMHRYTTDASTRTPQEILELVARNHLTIQNFIDKLPTWLRSTGAIRRKESGLVYLHLFTHLTSILTNRPFLSSYHPDSNLTRKYRTLAFRVARASALQVSSLIRHIPLSSPCVTMPYIVYSACTVLLLAPEDPAAMEGVRTCLACLDSMDETGYWVDSAKDAASRARALADKWGVELGSSRKALGVVGGGAGKAQGSSSPAEPSSAVSPTSGSTLGGAHISSQVSESDQLGVPSTRPSTSSSAQLSEPGQNIEYDPPSAARAHLDDVTLTRNIDAAIDRALQMVQPAYNSGAVLGVQVQSTDLPIQQLGVPAYESIPLSTQVDPSPSAQYQYQPSLRYPRDPTTGKPYHPYKRQTSKKKPLPHVAYASSHADPQHDLHISHSHWHSIIPHAASNHPFPPDPTACADVGACFNHTVEQGMVPAFVDRAEDPYAGVSMEWVKDVGSSFPRLGGGVPASIGGFGEEFDTRVGYGYQTGLGL